VTTIDSGKASFEKPTWNEAGTAFAVLRGVDDKAHEDKRYSVIGADFTTPEPTRTAFDPAKDAGFPADMVISANRAPE
jgi:hypothetical protein